MRCGNCKRNDDEVTVAHVRACYGVVEINGEDHEMWQVAPNAARLEPMSEKQYNYINALRIERDEPPLLMGYEKAIETMTKDWAKLEIKRLQGVPRTGRAAEIEAAIADIPEGWYAVDSLTGNNDLDFYKVEIPKEGKWTGYRFVNMIVGGKKDFSVRGRRKYDVLKAIADAGPEVAAMAYSRETNNCNKCGINLTKYASRVLGRGLTCAGKTGMGGEWVAIQSKWEAEQKAGNSTDTDKAALNLGRSEDHPVPASTAGAKPVPQTYGGPQGIDHPISRRSWGASVEDAVDNYLATNDSESATW
jgi:hypothetical protein